METNLSLPYFNYRQNDPFMRPDWRFERVLELVDRQPTPGRTTRFDDDYIRQARSFVLKWRAGSANARQRLWYDNPDLAAAYSIYEKSTVDPETRFMMEARLLSNQDFETIADSCHTNAGAIAWYEALFYNVKDHLRHHDWVVKHVLLPSANRMTSEEAEDEEEETMAVRFTSPPVIKPFMDMTLKFFAYYGGPVICEFMISGFRRGMMIRNREDIDGYLDTHFSGQIRRMSASAAGVFEVNKYNVMELFATHTKLMEIAQRQDSSEDNRSALEKGIHEMLTEIPWIVGSNAKEVFEGTKIGDYDQMAAELREDEIMLIMAGEQPTSIIEVPGLNIPTTRQLPAADKEVKT